MEASPISQTSGFWSIPSGKGWERLAEIAIRVLKGLGLLFANVVTIGLIPRLRHEFKAFLFGEAAPAQKSSVAKPETKQSGYYFFTDGPEVTQALQRLDGKEGCKLVSFTKEEIEQATVGIKEKGVIPVRVIRLSFRLDDIFRPVSVFEAAYPNSLYVFLDFGKICFAETKEKISKTLKDAAQITISANRILLVRTTNLGLAELEDYPGFLRDLRACSR